MANYGEAIREGFEYLMGRYPNVFCIGQGLWSPWYVGNSMTALDSKFTKERVIDTPVSELACTGAAVGAALCGYRPVVVHPRVDFMLLAVDQLVNQAAKWTHMFGGQVPVPVTVRAVINRGGEQGAQHSQALHSWFAHIPGLRVVMPANPRDARDLLISSVLCDDPVLYLDDRWLYDLTDDLPPVVEKDLRLEGPVQESVGDDLTIASAGFSTQLVREALPELLAQGITADQYDLRVLNPLDCRAVVDSVRRTGRLLVVDGDWSSCGLAGEVMARICEELEPGQMRAKPKRMTLPEAPAPTSGELERIYYPTAHRVAEAALALVRPDSFRASHPMGSRRS